MCARGARKDAQLVREDGLGMGVVSRMDRSNVKGDGRSTREDNRGTRVEGVIYF